jgi:hypothetical protein
MQSHHYLEAAAVLATLPVPKERETTSDNDRTDTRVCEICEETRPANRIQRTTIETVTTRSATICEACRHVLTHRPQDGQCRQCGDTIDAGHSFEIEFPLGKQNYPATLRGELCDDCASEIAWEILFSAVDADDEARHELTAILSNDTDHPKSAEGSP